MICTFECTFCVLCAVERFEKRCPTCGDSLSSAGGLASRAHGALSGAHNENSVDPHCQSTGRKRIETRRMVLLFAAAIFVARARAATTTPCETDSAWHRLDFWVGRWRVYDRGDGTLAGTSAIEKLLNGCAISVDWHDAEGGGEIRELFYYQKARQRWRQIWISGSRAVEGTRVRRRFQGPRRPIHR